MLAEVAGSQTATPVYRLLDHEGSLVATTNASGNVTGTNLMMPYGETLASNTTDPYAFTGLYQDTEYGGDDAWYRNYSTEQSRWLTPDPYNGSYDLMNPQSFNRYMYVNGNPLTFADPSGLSDGWATGIGGSPCTALGWTKPLSSGSNDKLNPCDPVMAALSWGLTPLVNMADGAINNIFNTALSTSLTTGQVAPFIGDAITIACSIDNNPTACGPKGWATVAFGNGITGKVVGDVASTISAGIAATDGVMCMASGFTLVNPACDIFLGDIIYVAASDLFSFLNNLFNGPAQFTGSLLPRPTDLGGLGTAPIGIPNQNLSIQGILGQPSRSAVPSPGMNLP
jgi:RHS repeat-associated protein